MAKSSLRGVGNHAGSALLLAFAMTTCTALAGVVATSQKSYFIDTRKPIVGLSTSSRLNTYHHGTLLIVR